MALIQIMVNEEAVVVAVTVAVAAIAEVIATGMTTMVGAVDMAVVVAVHRVQLGMTQCMIA